MAGTLTNGEKQTVRSSSDLDSSCDTSLPVCDAKDKYESDDVISVDGSASLTLDSLEGEDFSKEDPYLQEALGLASMHSQSLNVWDVNDSFYLHAAESESYKNKCKLSDLAVHSDHKKVTKSRHNHDKTSTPRSNLAGHDHLELSRKCIAKLQQQRMESKSPESDLNASAEAAESSISEPNANQLNDCASVNENSTKERSGDTFTQKDHSQVSCATFNGGHVCLRKSKSFTEESLASLDISSKHSRRSGIPRRKYSDQPTVTAVSSVRSTPQMGNSPTVLCRSHTLTSSRTLNHNPASPMRSAGALTPERCSLASFPLSPVKTPTLRRSSSQSETSFVWPAPFAGFCRDNITSRLRFERRHQDHDHSHLDISDTYLTPSQRKDLIIRELRANINQLNRQLEDAERELGQMKEMTEVEKVRIQTELQAEVETARATAESARKEITSLRESHEESVKMVDTLQQQLEDIKKEMAQKLSQAEEIFLEMYKKGRESAIFEREEELELRVKGTRSADVTETDLRNKLVRTQAELAKWQTIQRHESYHTMPLPGTEAETTLRFLKDSVFHFLTADSKTSDEHLRAIVRILRFSEVQREKIACAVIHKRNKSGW